MKLTLGAVHEGPAGRATEVVFTGEPAQPAHSATVSTWFLYCPGQSPAWQHYLLATVHLRDVPGAPPAHVSVPGATHEVMLMALDPITEPVATDLASWRFLSPFNVVEQIELPDDEAAKRLLSCAAKAVVDGLLPAEPPLSASREPWRTALIKTAAHERGEEHEP